MHLFNHIGSLSEHNINREAETGYIDNRMFRGQGIIFLPAQHRKTFMSRFHEKKKIVMRMSM